MVLRLFASTPVLQVAMPLWATSTPKAHSTWKTDSERASGLGTLAFSVETGSPTVY